MTLHPRDPIVRTWLPAPARAREAEILASVGALPADAVAARIEALIAENRLIHDRRCVNLNPATNVMNPAAEAALASGLTTRPSLGYAGMKYEMGLEAIEQIEVIAADLACRVFGARYAELRVGSGALANLYAFMATCKPGDAIVVPPPGVGGHVTHRAEGAAGLYGLEVHTAPLARDTYSVDIDGLAVLAERIRPRLITMGASLNLQPHPVAEVRAIADDVGADLLFDAAHACGMFAGGVWANPLDLGADLMTMSTYKSLGGPAGGLVFTNRADLAERVDAIAYPGLTANFDVGKTAALAITMLDWLEYGPAYARAMVDTSQALASALSGRGLPVFETAAGPTSSHQFAVTADRWGGGHQASLQLRRANILACAIGLPGGDEWGGIRFGTPEIVRWGMGPGQMEELAELIVGGLGPDPGAFAAATSEFRSRFDRLHFIRS